MPKKDHYLADFHSHSTFSDGKHTPKVMYEQARKTGLDVYALSDHNTVLGVMELYRKLKDKDLYKTQLISGFELSLWIGHFLVLGIDPFILHKQIVNEWKLEPNTYAVRGVDEQKLTEMLQWVQAMGGFTIVAHPCMIFGIMSATADLVARLYDQDLIQGAEVHNSDLEHRLWERLYNHWNSTAVVMADELKIPTYANSDAHHKDIMLRHNKIAVPHGADLLATLKRAPLVPAGYRNEIVTIKHEKLR